MLFELLSDIIKINDVLLITKNDGATCEIRSNLLTIRQKEKWITIGDNDGPAHMHINSEMIKSAEFIVSIVDGKDEYMFGLTCQKHKSVVTGKLGILQNEGKIHNGKISFTPVKSVGTDCVHGDVDDFVQIDMKKL